MRRILLLLSAVPVWICLQAGAEDLTSKQLAGAKKLYVAKCAKCHKFYEPKNYDQAEWDKWMESMSRKSKLKAADKELLAHYLADYRAGKIEKVK